VHAAYSDNTLVEALDGEEDVSQALCGAAEALFGAGALDDLLTIAVEHGGPRLPVLVPEIVDPPVQLFELGGDLGLVTLFGQDVPKLGSTGRGAFDFSSDVVQVSH
jgi:hypothetical protein